MYAWMSRQSYITLHALAPGDIHHSLKINTEKMPKTPKNYITFVSMSKWWPVPTNHPAPDVSCCCLLLLWSFNIFFFYEYIFVNHMIFRAYRNYTIDTSQSMNIDLQTWRTKSKSIHIKAQYFCFLSRIPFAKFSFYFYRDYFSSNKFYGSKLWI